MLNNNGKLIIFSAPSGAGKSTLIKEIIKNSSNDIELSVSATTRNARKGEKHGIDYFFITEDEFNGLKKKDSFIEFALVHGHQYGTLKSYVDEKIRKGVNIILDIDVQGFKQIKDSVNYDSSIFILPPSLEELRSRLIQRGHDSNEKIEERLKNAEIELTHAGIFDYIVLNDDFDRALKELSTIIFNGKIEIDSEKNLNLLSELLDKSTN